MLIPSSLRRDKDLTPDVDRLRDEIVRFLEQYDPSEASLILDGPGLGLSAQMLGLALLGHARLRAFRRVHCFSAGGYAYLWHHAHGKGQFKIPASEIETLQAANQRRHGAGIGAPLALLGRRIRSRYLYREPLAESVMAHAATEDFCHMRVADLPPNFRGWTYCQTDQRLVAAGPGTELENLSMTELVRAMTAVPVLYAPLERQGKRYADAVWAPQIREHLRALRRENSPCLLLHIRKHGARDGAHFVKVHRDGAGSMRVVVDFAYFMLGLTNREFDEGLRSSLFDLEPVD